MARPRWPSCCGLPEPHPEPWPSRPNPITLFLASTFTITPQGSFERGFDGQVGWEKFDDPDFVNDSIIITLRNVDRFDPVILDFTPAALDTEALDDLVNLMLGQAQSISASRAVARLRPLTKL